MSARRQFMDACIWATWVLRVLQNFNDLDFKRLTDVPMVVAHITCIISYVCSYICKKYSYHIKSITYLIINIYVYIINVHIIYNKQFNVPLNDLLYHMHLLHIISVHILIEFFTGIL